MKKLLLLSSLIALIAGLSACDLPNPTKENIGQVGGAVLGGVVASNVTGGSTLGTIGGTLAGAWLGGYVGKQMDNSDKANAETALEKAKTNQTVKWKNPDTGNEYAVTPTKTTEENNQVCRDYTTQAIIDGKKETIKGKACRQPNGTWAASK